MNNDPERRKTEKGFWDGTHGGHIRHRLPSLLNVGVANILRLLRPAVTPGARVLEVGFAPGKILAHVARRGGAIVSGIDYSEQGVAQARALFDHLGIEADLRCEDLFASSFPERSFDLVYSLGFVEHFDNAALAVAQHLRFLRPGGRAVIAIPNYGGVYGRLQARFDPRNLDIHNLSIMSPEAFRSVAAGLACSEVKSYRFGRLNPWLISLDRKLPRVVAFGLTGAANLMGLVQPVDIGPLCPTLVLELTRQSE